MTSQLKRLLFGCLAVAALHAQTPNDVIVNEILIGSSAGLKDAVELLVLKPGGVDMRNWTLADGGSPTIEGRIKLPSDSYLSAVPQYTRIVLVSNKGAQFPLPAEDTDPSGDSLMVLFADSGAVDFSLTQVGSFDFLSSDNAVLISGPDSASGTVIDIVSWGGDFSGWPAGLWTSNLSMGGRRIAYFTNQSSGGLINDNGSDGWAQDSLETSHTLGRVNPGQFLGGKPIRLGALTFTPSSPTVAQSDTVTLTIGHAFSLASAFVVYSSTGLPDSVSMTVVADSTYRGIIPPQDPGEQITFFVRVIDDSGNVAESPSYSYTVQSPLRIGRIQNYPTIPDPTHSVTVRAVVVSDVIPTVKLFTTINSAVDSVTMISADDTTFVSSVPVSPQAEGTVVTYQIRVTIGSYSEYSPQATYTVTDTFKIMNIGDLQANPGAYTAHTVSVTGVAVIGDGKLSATQRKFYVVQSEAAGVRGVQVFSFTLPSAGSAVQRGDSVIVRGYVKEFSSITEVTDTTTVPLTVSIVSTGHALPSPKLISSYSQIASVSQEGEWIKTKGFVTDVFTFTSGSANVTVSDGTNSIVIRIESAAGITASQVFQTNSSYLVSGIVGYFSPSTQIALGYASDVEPDTAGAVSVARAAIKVSPYPFNPRVGEVLKYGLRYGNNTRVIVRLYDVAGRLISTLVDEVKAVGRDETRSAFDYRTWNGRTRETSELVPIGTYILHVEVTDRTTGHSTTKSAPVVVATQLK